MEWQPIETAPNYKWILVCAPVDGPGHDRWAVFVGRQHGPTKTWALYPGNYNLPPTHWMPLPVPPKRDARVNR